ncbi:MAG: M17 family metallopeptidase [Mycoplasmatales bacterium]
MKFKEIEYYQNENLNYDVKIYFYNDLKKCQYNLEQQNIYIDNEKSIHVNFEKGVLNDISLEGTITLDFTNVVGEELEDFIIDKIYGMYSYGDNKNTKIDIIFKNKIDIKYINHSVKSKIIINNLVLSPSNILNPESYKKIVKQLFSDSNVNVKDFSKEEIKSDFPGIDAVSRGSQYNGEMIVLEYNKKAKYSVALVGKGITFDTGGFNIKTGNQNYSKVDMTGSATLVGLMYLISNMNVDIGINIILCLAENAVGENMMLPGEIIEYSNNVKVEITNTDAEGRLVLADGLIYAQKLNPDAIFDIATLTGGAGATFGSDFTVIMSNNKESVNFFTKNDFENDFFGYLPLHKKYMSKYNSDVADMTNSVNNFASTIMAGLFLEKFVEHDNWIHLDIAATATSFEKANVTVPGSCLKPLYLYLLKFGR